MKKQLTWVIVLIAVLMLEAKVEVFGIRPNLTAVLAYYFGLRNGAVKGILYGSLIGIAVDSLSGGMLGPNLLGKGAVGFFSSYIAEGFFFKWTPVLGVLGISALTVLDGIAAFALTALFVSAPTSLWNAALIMLGQAALNAMAGPFIKPDED